MKQKEVTTTELFDAFSAFSEKCATKDDLKSFATKNDLKSFATKDDLKSFATKDDLKEVLKLYATKEDLQEVKSNTEKILQLLPSLIHKEDRKVNTLVERLVAKRIFAHAEVADILDIHPLVP